MTTGFDKRAIKLEIKKAFLVIERTTSKPGPKEYGNTWPHMVREPLAQEDVIPDDDESYRALMRLSVQPHVVSWAKSVVDAINTLEEDERRLVYFYFGERMKNRTDEEIAKKNGQSRQVQDRQLTPILQKLAAMFCRRRSLRRSEKVDEADKNPVIPHVKSELRLHEKAGSIQSWMEPDGRPKAEDLIEVPYQP